MTLLLAIICHVTSNAAAERVPTQFESCVFTEDGRNVIVSCSSGFKQRLFTVSADSGRWSSLKPPVGEEPVPAVGGPLGSKLNFDPVESAGASHGTHVWLRSGKARSCFFSSWASGTGGHVHRVRLRGIYCASPSKSGQFIVAAREFYVDRGPTDPMCPEREIDVISLGNRIMHAWTTERCGITSPVFTLNDRLIAYLAYGAHKEEIFCCDHSLTRHTRVVNLPEEEFVCLAASPTSNKVAALGASGRLVVFRLSNQMRARILMNTLSPLPGSVPYAP